MSKALYGDRDPEDVERLGLQRLSQLLKEVPLLAERVEKLRAISGSVLEYDDLQTPYEPISYQTQHLASVSIDHLQTYASLLADSQVLPMVGGYGLIRGAIEAAGLGVWVLGPNTRDSRVHRSLRLTWDQETKASEIAGKLGHEVSARLARTHRRLEEIKNMRKANRQLRIDQKFPTMTDVLRIVGKSLANQETFSPLVAWSVCSSLTHANRATTQYVLESKLVGKINDHASERMLTSSFAMNALLLAPAVGATTALIELFEHRTTQVEPQRGRKESP